MAVRCARVHVCTCDTRGFIVWVLNLKPEIVLSVARSCHLSAAYCRILVLMSNAVLAIIVTPTIPISLKRWLIGAMQASGLSLREYAILHLKSRGYTIVQIARASELRKSSVNTSLANSYRKLRVKGFKAAIAQMSAEGWLLESVPGCMIDAELGLT